MIQLTRLPGYDTNGNPRYVCHFTNLLTAKDSQTQNNYIPGLKMSRHYILALARARKIGGKKFNNKTYGGGIVFADYESNIRANIARILAEDTAAGL